MPQALAELLQIVLQSAKLPLLMLPQLHLAAELLQLFLPDMGALTLALLPDLEIIITSTLPTFFLTKVPADGICQNFSQLLNLEEGERGSPGADAPGSPPALLQSFHHIRPHPFCIVYLSIQNSDKNSKTLPIYF